ncbi:non-ribosomal peptide synthetase [Thalassomonas actiniarum]|uniref:Non-ribosomal peptide synthetase n=1 Tax=Thalassomonas actiniarum TaxID=485447 RepID=A0AAF0C4Q2_9GAMM|nr:non-ribosomal peptide synthetase [Thalassomonas actiniarum]WDE02532.1 non-ribosomal peptide synthetase [Thalassomonas actiniarum]
MDTDAASLLSELEMLDIRLSLDDGKLRYSAPKGALQPLLLKRLSDHKADLIRLLEQRSADRQQIWEEVAIPRQPRGKGLPLSFAQQRFWFLDQLDQGNSATFVMPPVVLRFEGKLNILALQQALNEVVQRHEVLRSAFRIEEDVPVQRVLPEAELALPLSDLTALTPAEKEQRIDQVIREQALQPFDLQHGDILMRALVLKLAENEHIFMLTMHHIIGDGWSMGILVDELSQLYRARIAGEAIDKTLAPLPVQYADYAVWERKRMTGQRLARHRDYWLAQLKDAPDFLPLATDHPRPKVRNNQGSAVYFQLGSDSAGQLARLCSDSGVTPFMALLSAFAVLLYRYTGEQDMVIGSPIAVRPHSQSEALVGLFLNTLALRIDLSANPSFHSLLARVRKTALQGYEHSEMPFDQVLQALDLERNPEHTPLFQVLFALQNAPMGNVELDGLSISSRPTQSLHSPFDLVLSLEESENDIQGFFRYNTDLFERASIERMLGHFRLLLQGLLTTPQEKIATLAMLTPPELAQLRDWRGGQYRAAADNTLAQAFTRQAAASPGAVALRFGDTGLTYRELNERANQLTRRLQKMGVVRGDFVGLCSQRSLELIIGIVGILKAGAAYIPLDPAYPQERLAYMAQDSGIRLLVTYRSEPSLSVTMLDLADPSLAQESTAEPGITAAAEDVAYVIYTSGSTGRPKGVEVSHRNVIRLFSASESLFGFGADDTWSLFHSYAFDFSVWELWGALLYGGQAVVVPLDIARSSEQFQPFLRQNGVTVLNQTPSAFRQLIDADCRLQASREPLPLKWVIFGGEALDPRSLSAWVERYGLDAPELINMYGITETTVHVSYYRLRQEDIDTGTSVIGRPLPDLSLTLVDGNDQLVPLGVPGEMLIGGGGVARGYLNLPELTAERFISDAFTGQEAKQRLYRSGDLARWRADGSLEYLGRIDHQVKVRGFRIELGEIERCLGKLPQVREAVVLSRQEAGGARLVAYAVSDNNRDTALPALLRKELLSRLPEYMIPAAVLVLPSLPLTANGKLDRKKLDSLFLENRSGINTGVPLSAPPQTALEKLLATLWCQVLDIERIGLDDNFFELGGDSIRGAILANKIQQRIESVVYVVALFEAPTIRLLIDYLRRHYPEAMARMGEAEIRQLDDAFIDEQSLTDFRALIPPTPSYPVSGKLPGNGKKNPRAIFVLSPPRSGSTLLRVLLGGHSDLFSPPELELLGFDTLGQRKKVCSGRDAFWLEGTLRAVMQACDVDADGAREIMASRESADMPVQAFYGELQGWLGQRILVDKSPSYALDPGIMQRAEAYFDEPLYIHLHRHPYGMIHSFEEAKLDQIFFRYPHQLPVRRLGELIWLHSHRNIGQFLANIPARRQISVSFEQMTQQPEATVKQLCQFIGINFSADMLDIYNRQQQQRMTDGIHRESKMLGDVKFHSHQQIDAGIAERWRQNYRQEFLGEPSLQMAKVFGYNPRINTENLPIPQLERKGGSLPLSFAQQRLWFLDQLEGAGAAYNMPVALRIKGELAPDAMAASLDAIVRRHETLRSHFETVRGEPRVRLVDALPAMATVDLSHLVGQLQQQALAQHIASDAKQVFNLATGPLFRCSLLKLAADDHVVLVNMHHIVSDGWSMGIIVNEWSRLYDAFVAGQASPLAPLAVQYGDYAAWQHEQLKSGKLGHQLAYWRKRLAGAPALLALPTDRPRPAVQQFHGDIFKLTLNGSLSLRLKRYAEQSGVSLYMFLLAAFAVLLMRYSGQRDIVIGSPTANRSRSELEPLVGFFVNTLVMRLDVAGEQAFDGFLKQVREAALEAYANQEVSFEQLVEELKPRRNLSYSPLFQVMFSMQNTPAVTPDLTGLEVSEISGAQVVSKYDLTLEVSESGTGLEACFEYNSDLFDRDTIKRLAGHYSNLLQSILTAPQQALARLAILDQEEEDCLLKRWNHTRRPIDGPLTIQGMFEKQAGKTPNAVAVKCGADSLSYRELNQRSQQLAQRLRALGLAEGSLAAVCLPRSADMLVALLAVLKSGSAYVPLDPKYPRDRIREVLEDAGVSLLLTQAGLLPSFSSLTCPVFCPDAGQQDCAVPEARIPEAKEPETKTPQIQDNPALAYVIYTSGSTGKPKGVAVSHHGAVNFLSSMAQMPGITASDTLLAVTTVAFDIAVLELYLPLTVGATLVIADEETVRDGTSLMQTLLAEQVTVMQATPATWRLLLASGWQGDGRLKVLCGGEALPSMLAQQLLPDVASLWNLYGPTEATVWSSLQQVTPGDLIHARIPIGRPIANTRIYILDSCLSPQPVGVSGELFIGGDCLANAYLNRPELTAAAFIEDPFLPGQRLYRTGDLGRYLPDGRIEYLGRNDQQIKIRGFRVEPGEVEHVLGKQPGVDMCAVVLDRPESENTRLIGYYLGGETDRSQLKQALGQVLPDYMVPDLLLRLEQMPLTENGKVDRRALARLEIEQTSAEYLGARDTLELELLRIWQEVLGVKAIGIRDNFFDLGGHSIIAVRLMAKIARQFDRQLPLASLFQGSTVEAQAQLLRSGVDDKIWSSVVPVQSQGQGEPFFCAAGAGGNLVYFNELARAMTGSHPFIGLQPPGLDGETPPYTRVEDLARHYLDEIQHHGYKCPRFVAGHSFGGLVAFDMAAQLNKLGHAPQVLVLIDTPAPHFFQPTGQDWSQAQWLAQVSEIISHLYQVDAAISSQEFASLDHEAQLVLLHQRLIARGVLPEQNNVSFLRGFIEVYKANLCVDYSPAKLPATTRVLLLRSKEQQPEHLITEQFATLRTSLDLGWQRYFEQPVTVTEVPGDHLTMMRSPNAEVLTREISDFISS